MNQMNDIQIEDKDYEMVNDDDDVVSLGDESAWVVEQYNSEKSSKFDGN